MLAQGTIWGSETKVEAGAGAAPATRKPGQSAHARSLKKYQYQHWRPEMPPEFSTSTGNNFQEFRPGQLHTGVAIDGIGSGPK